MNKYTRIKISSIISPIRHDRCQYDAKLIMDLAENIKANGLLQPIVVRSIEDGKYERVSGFRRIEAYKILGYDEIDANVIEANDIEALEAMLSENIVREELNIYDKAVFFEEIIFSLLNASKELKLHHMGTIELRQRLERMRYCKRRGNVELSDDEIEFQQIINERVLKRFGNGIDTFVKFLRLLDFDARILTAVKDGLLDRSNASELNRLSPKKFQHHIPEAINRAVANKMSKREISEMVNVYKKTKSKKDNSSIKKEAYVLFAIKTMPPNKRNIAKAIISEAIEKIQAL